MALSVILFLLLFQAALVTYLAATRRKLYRTNIILKKMSLAVEYSPLSIIMTDTSGAIEYVSPRFTDLTGYTPEEVDGQNPRILKSGITSPEKHRNMWDTICAGRVWQGELCNRKKNGEIYWENAAIAPVIDKHGVISHFVAIKENITEYKLAEEALIESERRFRAITEYTCNWESWIGLRGELLWVNPAVATVTGYSREEIQHMQSQVLGIVLDEDKDKVLAAFKATVSKKTRVSDLQCRIRRKDAQVRWISICAQPIYADNGEYLGIRSSIRDVNDRKETELALQAAKEHAEALIEATNTIVVSLDINGMIRSFNKAAEKITGYSSRELENCNWFEVVVPRGRYPEVWQEFERLSSGGLPRNFENPILTKNGEERFIVWQNNKVIEHGQIVGTVSFGVDITERKLAELELAEYQEQLRSLASELSLAEERERRRIAAGIHDNVVQSLALCKIKLESLLKDDRLCGENQHDITETRDILNAVITDSRELIFDLSPPLLYEVGLVPAVQSLLERVGKKYGLSVDVPVHAALPRFPDNLKVSIYQMVRELLINVVKYAAASKVTITFAARDDHIVIQVNDDGVGFEPLQPKDSGYGLFSIKQRLRQIGGDLRVNSTPGSGASVQIMLPLPSQVEG